MTVKPRLVGVVHLPPLPGAPRFRGSMDRILEQVSEDAEALARAGFDAMMVENFGDVPFFAEQVPAVTVSAMTACALAAREAASQLALGINVLRNDLASAISIAAVVGAEFVRVNVLTGARVTDQGIVQGRAAEALRLRKALDASQVGIWADVDVKHAAPLAPRDIGDEAEEVVDRSMAEAVLVTGRATGAPVDEGLLARVREAVPRARIYVASGASEKSLKSLAAHCDGVVVGSALRKGDKAGQPIDPKRAVSFAKAFRKAFR